MPNTFVNVSAPTVTQVKLQLSSPYIAADAAIQSIALNLAKDTVYYDTLSSYSSPTGNTLNNITTVPTYTDIIPASLLPTGIVNVKTDYCEADGAKLIVNQSIFERDTYVLGFANVLNNVTQTPTMIYNLLKDANSLSGQSGSLVVNKDLSNVVSTHFVTLEVESNNKSAIPVDGYTATLDTTDGNFNNQEYELYKTVDKLTFNSSGNSFMNVHSYMTVDSTTNQYARDINNTLNSTSLSDVLIEQQHNPSYGSHIREGFGLYKLSQVPTTVYDSNVVGSGLFTNDACTTACNNTGKALSLNHLATHVPYDLTWKVEKSASGSGYTLPAGQAVNTLGSLTHTKGVANAPYMVSMANPNNITHRLNITEKGSLNKKTGATADLDYVTVGTEQEHLGVADYTKKTVFGVPNTLIANGRVGRTDSLTATYPTYIFTQYDIDNRGSNYSEESQVSTGLTGANLTDNSVAYVVHSYSECSDRYKNTNNATSMMNSSLNSNSTGSKLVINSSNLPYSYTEYDFAGKTVAGSAFSRLDLTLTPTTTYTYDSATDTNNSVYADIDYVNATFPLQENAGVVGLTADVIGSGAQINGNKLALRCTPKSTADFGSWSAKWGWAPNQSPLASSGKQLTYSIIHTYCAQHKDINSKLVFPSKFVGPAKPAYLSVYPVITAFSSNYAEVSLQADLRNSANGKLATEVVGSLGRVIVGSNRVAMFESVDKQICFGPYTNIKITVPAFKIAESDGVKNASNGDVIYSYEITYNDNNSSNNWTAFDALVGTTRNGYTLTSQICGTYNYSADFSEILCLKAEIIGLVSGVETPLSTGVNSVDPWYDFDESDTTIVIGTETFTVNINWNQNLTTVIASDDVLYVDMTHPTSTISVSAANVIKDGETSPSAWSVDDNTCVYNDSVLSASIVQSENSNQSGYSSVITVQLGSDTIATLTYNNPAPSANIDLYWQPIPIFTVKRNGVDVITLNTSERVKSGKIMRIDDGVYVRLPVFSQIANNAEISFSLWNDAIYELGLIDNSVSSYSRGSVTPRVLNSTGIANNMTFSPTDQKSVTFTNVRGNMGNTSPTNAYTGETTQTSWIVLTRTVATGTFTIGSVTSTPFDIYNSLNLDIGYNSGQVQQSASSAANPIGLTLNFVSSSLLSDDAVTYSINVDCDTYTTTIDGNSIPANTTVSGIVAANGVVGTVGKVDGVDFSGSAAQPIYVDSICAAQIPRVVPDPTDTTANLFSDLDSTNYQQFINYMTNVSNYMGNIKNRDNSYNNGFYTQNYPIQQPDQNGKTVKDYYNIFYDIIVTNLPADNKVDYLKTNMAALTDAYNNFIKCVLYVFNVPTSLLDYWNKSTIPGMSRDQIESAYSQVNVDAWLHTNINTASNIPNVTDAAIQGNFWDQGVNSALFNMTVYWAANYSLHYFGGRHGARTITVYADASSSYDISFTVQPLVLNFQSKSTPIVYTNVLNCTEPKLEGGLAYSNLRNNSNVTIPYTNIKISRMKTGGRAFYELPQAITSYYFQVQDSQYKFTTIAPGAYDTLIERYVNITSVAPNGDGAARTYNPFSSVTNANNTAFGIPISDHYYALATTAVSTKTFPLQPLSLKMYQSSEEGVKYSTSRYLYNGDLTHALLNIGADAPNGLKSISGGSTSNPGSALYTVEYYQDFSPDGAITNYATERITFTFPENIPAGEAGVAKKYTVKASGAEDVYAYAMGAVIKRDQYGFPKAVEVEMYKSAEISKVSTLAQSSNNQNPIMTYTVGFSKKCVKTYSLGGLFIDITTSTGTIDVHAVIAGLQDPSGLVFSEFTDLTTAEKAKHMLTFTPLNAKGLTAFGNMLHSAGSNIEYTLYTAISQPIRVTVDLAGNEISRLHENGSSTAKFLRLTR